MSRLVSQLRTLISVLSMFLHSLFCITVRGLHAAGNLLAQALGLLVNAADRFACCFLYLARGFLDATLDLIFVNAHNLNLLNIGEQRSRLRSTGDHSLGLRDQHACRTPLLRRVSAPRQRPFSPPASGCPGGQPAGHACRWRVLPPPPVCRPASSEWWDRYRRNIESVRGSDPPRCARRSSFP